MLAAMTAIDDLRALSDLAELRATVARGGVAALIGRCERLLAELDPSASIPGSLLDVRTLALVRSALLMDQGFLEQHPAALLQSLWWRLWWHDADRGAPARALAERWEAQAATDPRPWLRARSAPRTALSLRPMRALRGHAHPVETAAFAPDGRRLASIGGGDVLVWDLEGGDPMQLGDGEFGARTVAWSPDGATIATAEGDFQCRLWDARDGRLLAELDGDGNEPTSLAFSPDGARIAVGHLGWLVRVFDIASRVVLRVLGGHQQSVLAVAWHPDGRHLASGASDGTVRVWDLEVPADAPAADEDDPLEEDADAGAAGDDQEDAEGGAGGSFADLMRGEAPEAALDPACVATLGEEEFTSYQHVAFSPDGTWLAGSGGGAVTAWRTSDWEPAWELAGPAAGHARLIGWMAPDRAVTAVLDLGVCRVRVGPPRDAAPAREASLRGMPHAVDARGRLACVDETGAFGVRPFDELGEVDPEPAPDQPDGVPRGALPGVRCVIDGASGGLVGFSQDGIHRLDPANGTFGPAIAVPEQAAYDAAAALGGGRLIYAVHVPTRRGEAAAPAPAPLVVCDAATGAHRATLANARPGPATPGLGGTSTVLAVHADTLAHGDATGGLRLWDLAGRGLRHELPAHEHAVVAVAFIGDGSQLLSLGKGGYRGPYEAFVWDVASGRKLLGTAPGSADPQSVAIDDAGTLAACARPDGGIYVFVVGNGRTRAILTGGTTDVRVVASELDGGRFASVDEEGVARLWDLDAGCQREIATGLSPGSVGLAAGRLWCAGRRSDSGGHAIGVWDAATGDAVALLDGEADASAAVGAAHGLWLRTLPDATAVHRVGEVQPLATWPERFETAHVLAGGRVVGLSGDRMGFPTLLELHAGG